MNPQEKVLHLELIDLFRPVPAELVEGLEHGEARRPHAAFQGALLAHGAFAVEQTLEELEVRPGRRRRVGGQRRVMLSDVAEFQIREVFGEDVHGSS